MLHNSVIALFETLPAVAVLETSSRFLLTLGVALFIAYVICMIAANILGLVYRYTSPITRRNRSTGVVEPDTSTRHTSSLADKSSSVAVKREVS